MGKNNKRLTTEEFIRRGKSIHGERYLYDKTVYVNQRTPVIITCRKHGDFLQTAGNHINPLQKNGCPRCAREHQNDNRRKSTEDFIKESKAYYGKDRYDYSKTKYIDAKTSVILICHEKDENGVEHGEFETNPHNHLSSHNHNGCPKCGGRLPLNTEIFIKQSNKRHNGKYIYGKTIYTNAHDKVIITCPEHGDFLQKADSHLRGCGCPICNEKKLEKECRILLEENNIKFIFQCGKSTFDWLGLQSLDFYLPDYNIAIECQGVQHYNPVEFFGGIENFKKQKRLDEQKYGLCKNHNVDLIYYTLPELKQNTEFINTEGLINYIKNKYEI